MIACKEGALVSEESDRSNDGFRKDVYTIGSYKTGPVRMLSVLLDCGVTHLYDTRKADNSKCAGKYLESLFNNIEGITYKRVPQLSFAKSDCEVAFTDDDFILPDSVQVLWATLVEMPDLNMASGPPSVNALNKVISSVSLCNHLVRLIPEELESLDCQGTIKRLITATQKFRVENEKALPLLGKALRSIQTLNRLLLEYFYSPETPPLYRSYHRQYLAKLGKKGTNLTRELIDMAPVPCFLGPESLSDIEKSYRKALLDKLSESDKKLRVLHLNGECFIKDSIRHLPIHKGKVYDLKDSFDRVNQGYFNQRYRHGDVIVFYERSSNSLGFFEHPDVIAISPYIDNKLIPEAVLDEIMYHELLHLQRCHDGLPFTHCSEFYMEETRFKEYAEKYGFDFGSVWGALKKGVQQ